SRLFATPVISLPMSRTFADAFSETCPNDTTSFFDFPRDRDRPDESPMISTISFLDAIRSDQPRGVPVIVGELDQADRAEQLGAALDGDGEPPLDTLPFSVLRQTAKSSNGRSEAGKRDVDRRVI